MGLPQNVSGTGEHGQAEVAEMEMKSSRNIWGQRDDNGPSLCTPKQTETKSAIFSS